MIRKPPAHDREAQRAAAKRAALRAVRKARLTAEASGVELSDWEGEFLGSVEERAQTYGRAFADPEKGGPGQAFSVMQTRKLKEITAKAKGEQPSLRFRRKSTGEDT